MNSFRFWCVYQPVANTLVLWKLWLIITIKWGHSSKGLILLYLIQESKQQFPKCPELDVLHITS
jgi:hypothetical protein